MKWSLDMNKLEGMPRPNIINLKECDDRRKYTSLQFSKLGVEDIKFHIYERYENSDVKYVGDKNLIEATTKGVTSSHLLTIKWWYENTDEPVGIFFEDDVDFSPVQHWNFTFQEFINRLGSKWGALHLCSVHENHPVMVPRMREQFDHGLQCYMIKRKYASKLVKFYFDQGDDTIHYRMPLGSGLSTENNVLWGFDRVYTFPLFNHNVVEFTSKNIFNPDAQVDASVLSYHNIRAWWENKGRTFSLDDIFDYDRADKVNQYYRRIHY